MTDMKGKRTPPCSKVEKEGRGVRQLFTISQKQVSAGSESRHSALQTHAQT